MRLRAALACVCLLGAKPASQEQDVAALASAILAAPAPERARLLDERGVKPTHALIEAMVVAAGRRLTAADFVGAGEIYEYTDALARSIGDDVSAGGEDADGGRGLGERDHQ